MDIMWIKTDTVSFKRSEKVDNRAKYEEPKIEVVAFETEDIITTSGGDNPIEMEEIDDW